MIQENISGGKGTYCFIGKILSLNTPSCAEEYMDKLLRLYEKHQFLTIDMLDELALKPISDRKDSFWFKEDEFKSFMVIDDFLFLMNSD